MKAHCIKQTAFGLHLLVSNKELVKSMYKSLKKLKATHIKTIENVTRK